MSPYEDRILDVKLLGGLSGSVTVTIEEGWADALLCLGLQGSVESVSFCFLSTTQLPPFYDVQIYKDGVCCFLHLV